MKNILLIMLVLIGVSCSKVPAGNVGVKVNLLGSDKGVELETLGVGRYWIGFNEELHIFPTFQKTYTWTKDPTEGSETDESITFQTREGMSVNADVGISFSLDPTKVAILFQKYRRGVDELTDTVLRNAVRDSMNEASSTMAVEDIYSGGKIKMFNDVTAKLKQEFISSGIIIDNIYLVGSLRLPANVVAALNSKIEATQRAQQRENEVQEAKAQAAKEIAQAEGEAKAMLTRAKAEAESNRLKQATLTRELIQYEAVQRWDGKLSTVNMGGGGAIIDLKSILGGKANE